MAEVGDIFSQLAEQNGKDKSDEERVESVLSHPLFMSSCNQEHLETDTVNAIQSLIFDASPQEVAENFKVQGNAYFAGERTKWKDAIKFYTQGITVNCNNFNLNSILHSNRAAVNLELSNYRSCLYDCARAITFDSTNIKAYYRSVKALIALDRIEEGIDCCQKALIIDPGNQHFVRDLKKLDLRRIELSDLKRLSRAKDEMDERVKKALKDCLDSRPYRISGMNKRNIDAIQHPDAPLNQIKLASDGILSFPVIFLYPEYNQSDSISQFYEGDTFYSHFQMIFEESAPWDTDHKYHSQNLDWYFETFVSEKNSADYPQLVSGLSLYDANNFPSQSLSERYVNITLADLLSNPKFTVVNQVVTIIILSRDSSFGVKYLKDFAARNS